MTQSEGSPEISHILNHKISQPPKLRKNEKSLISFSFTKALCSEAHTARPLKSQEAEKPLFEPKKGSLVPVEALNTA